MGMGISWVRLYAAWDWLHSELVIISHSLFVIVVWRMARDHICVDCLCCDCSIWQLLSDCTEFVMTRILYTHISIN